MKTDDSALQLNVTLYMKVHDKCPKSVLLMGVVNASVSVVQYYNSTVLYRYHPDTTSVKNSHKHYLSPNRMQTTANLHMTNDCKEVTALL